MNPDATEPDRSTTAPTPPPARPRLRRVLAVAAGVAMVPALYAAATAATGGGGDGPRTTAAASRSADDPIGSETEVEHGVVVDQPHGGATTPTVPDVTTPSLPGVPVTAPEQEAEHPVPEPGDDNGVDGQAHDVGDDHGGAVAPAPVGSQSFSSAGGSIVVASNGTSISLAASSPVPGFTVDVHDNGPTRVEVRFVGSGTEWRIRVELRNGGLTSEVTQHG